MQDKELYQQILALSSPWQVTRVELDHAHLEIRVRVDHPTGTKFCCPDCNTELPCHDHAEEQKWRYLDSCQFKTILIARQPRINCPKHVSDEQLAGVEAIAMDMSAAYVKSAKETIPLAEEKIVHDSFHIMKMATEAVNKVRKGEHRRLL